MDTTLAPPRLDALPGDLLFMQSPGTVQRLVHSARDRYRHVAIVVDLGGHRWVLEAGRAGFRARPLTTVVEAYDRIDVVRLSPCEHDCGERVASVALELMERPTQYPGRGDLAVAGLLSYSRTYLPLIAGGIRSRLHAIVSDREEQRRPDQQSTLCASLVLRALRRTCPLHRPNIDLATTKAAGADRHDSLADVFALPDDIWRALPSVQHFVLVDASCDASINDLTATTTPR